MRLVTTNGLSVRLGGNLALDHVDFHIDSGEIVTIVGPNGSGKTTLLRAVIGAARPTSGTVRLEPGLTLGYVPQAITIDATLPLTVRRFMNLPNRRAATAVQDALDLTDARGLIDRQIVDLSGGQTQRVLLARALLDGPQLLILDEPTTGLDQAGSADFYGLIADLRDRLGLAVLMVSHELHVVMSASDRVICLNGHVCCHGTPDTVASAPEYRALFGRGTRGALALYRHEHDHAHDAHDHEGGH